MIISVLRVPQISEHTRCKNVSGQRVHRKIKTSPVRAIVGGRYCEL